jgi:glyoxylase-like metal-dependent hydrolase (beta-lactamase superfamily II)
MSGGTARRLPDAAGYEVWLLCVGALDFPEGELIPNREVTICVNALLLRGYGKTLLVDAGSGPADVLWPGAAELDRGLSAAGVSESDVDGVVLTHLDFDHAGGALTGTWPGEVRPVFPRAIMSAVDFGVGRPGEPEDWDVGTRLIEAYDQAGGLELVADGAEFRPQLRLVVAPGHRPGHAVVLIGQELVFGADLVHHEAHIDNPHWDTSNDVDPELALTTRRSWIARLEETATPVAFSHIAQRGLVASGPTWKPD